MTNDPSRRTKAQEVALLRGAAKALRSHRIMSWDWTLLGDNPWQKAAEMLEQDATFLERVVVEPGAPA